jgi:hypothetical protein
MAHLRRLFVELGNVMRSHEVTAQAWVEVQDLQSALLANEYEVAGGEMWPIPASLKRRLIGATDASDPKWSIVDFDTKTHRGKQVDHGWFSEILTSLAIYYKEMEALCRLLEYYNTQADEVKLNCTITVAVDNMGVIGSVQKLMGPPLSWGWLDRIERICRQNIWRLDLRYVKSDANVAHSATHDEAWDEIRESETWDVVKRRSQLRWHYGLRHLTDKKPTI